MTATEKELIAVKLKNPTVVMMTIVAIIATTDLKKMGYIKHTPPNKFSLH